MRLSILDDYQGVALEMADWAPVRARGIEIAVERFPFADTEDVVRSLADSEIVMWMGEFSMFTRQVRDAILSTGTTFISVRAEMGYVGFTRARKVLRVTWCEKRQDAFSRGKTARFLPSAPSRFLLESGLMSRDEYQDAVRLASEGRAAARGVGGRGPKAGAGK